MHHFPSAEINTILTSDRSMPFNSTRQTMSFQPASRAISCPDIATVMRDTVNVTQESCREAEKSTTKHAKPRWERTPAIPCRITPYTLYRSNASISQLYQSLKDVETLHGQSATCPAVTKPRCKAHPANSHQKNATLAHAEAHPATHLRHITTNTAMSLQNRGVRRSPFPQSSRKSPMSSSWRENRDRCQIPLHSPHLPRITLHNNTHTSSCYP